MTQDEHGFLWMGTQDGLNRWDGHQFMVFRRDTASPNSLSDNFIRALLIDSKNRLWVGTHNGLSLLKDDGFRNIYLPTGETNPAGNRIHCMAQDANNRIWVGTGNGLLRFSSPYASDEAIHFDTFLQSGEDSSVLGNAIRCLFTDSVGRVWVGASGGLARFDEATGKFVKYSPKSMGRLAVDAIKEDGKGRLWLGTPGGLFSLDPETGQASELMLFQDPKMGRIPIEDLLIDHLGSLWLGTRGHGLLRMEKKADLYLPGDAPVFTQFTTDPSNPQSISHPFISRLFEDRFGSIWVGTDASGLNIFHPEGQPFQLINSKSAFRARLSSNVVLSILRDSRNLFWVSILGDGLNQIPFKDLEKKGMFRRIQLNSNSNPDIRQIFEDHQQNIWLTTRGAGLLFLPAEFAASAKTGEFIQITDDGKSPSSLGENYTRFIFQDRRDNIWIGTERRGLSRLVSDFPREEPRFQQFQANQTSPEKGPASSEMRAMAAHPEDDDVFWLGCYGGGVSRMSLKNGSPEFVHFRHSKDPRQPSSQDLIRCLLPFNNQLWIGSDGGLSVLPMDAETPQFRTWLAIDGLPNEVVYAILPDSQGYLWLSTNNGLSRFHPERETFRNFTFRDGLQANEFNAGAAFLDQEGLMYFGGVDGLNLFNPAHVKDQNFVPQTVLTDISVFNKRVSLVESDGKKTLKLSSSSAFTPFIPSLPNGALPELVVDYHQNMLSFSFAGLNSPFAEETHHQYYLEGFDTAWLETNDNNRRATYTNLNPGRYTFRVKSANEMDVWDEEGAALQIRVLPPPWRTPLAYGFYVAAIFAAFFSYMLRQRTMRSRLRFLVQERTLQLEVANRRLTRQNEDIRKAQRQLIVQNKMASMVRLTKGIAHELRNPLNFVNNFAEVAVKTGQDIRDMLIGLKERPDPKNAEELDELVDDLMQSNQLIAQHGRRMERIVSGMMNMGEPESQTTAADDINFLVKQAVSLALYGLSGEPPPFQVHLIQEDRQKPLTISAQGVSRVLMSLLNNSREAVLHRMEQNEPGYQPEIRITVRDDGKNLMIIIWDNGPGIPEAHREHIFEPFFSYNKDEEHVGLGLYTSYEIIVREHMGQLNMKTKEGSYTQMEVVLPH